jgi:HK97 gp10 family phage protein
MAKGFTVTINVKEAVGNIRKVGVEARRIVNNELEGLARGTVADAQKNVPVNEGKLRSAIGFNSIPSGFEITVNADYAAYVEFGTKRFAAQYVNSLPPDWKTFAAQFKGKGGGDFEQFIERIYQWVRRKKIGATYDVKTRRRVRQGRQTAETTDRATAYAIAINIARNGIRPQPFLYPAFEKNRVEFIRNLKRSLNL